MTAKRHTYFFLKYTIRGKDIFERIVKDVITKSITHIPKNLPLSFYMEGLTIKMRAWEIPLKYQHKKFYDNFMSKINKYIEQGDTCLRYILFNVYENYNILNNHLYNL
jgi:hypothetical protein